MAVSAITKVIKVADILFIILNAAITYVAINYNVRCLSST